VGEGEMPEISLTDLVDILSTSGTPKLTKVKRIKQRGPYSPAKDFYKPFREHIISIHRENGSKEDLEGLLLKVTDAKKLNNYINAY